MSWQILRGDCVEQMRTLEDSSIDAVVTDPPYGLGKEPDIAAVLRHWLAGDDYEHRGGGFMGNSWDSFVPGPAVWREVFRVLKPGGHLLSFAGSRTVDLMGISIRVAGFEIRDQIQFLYGSGFPKSLDVSKAIDKAAGAEREDIGPNLRHHGGGTNSVYAQDEWTKENFAQKTRLSAPATEEAAQWQGWGTALKPAHEPIVVARKPLSGTVAATLLEHGTGALNIDGCRIEGEPPSVAQPDFTTATKRATRLDATARNGEMSEASGRWPANVLLDPDAADLLDAQTGESISRKGAPRAGVNGDGWGMSATGAEYNDRGGASRFFPTFGFSTMETCPLHGDVSTKAANTCAGKSKGSSADSSPTDGSGSRSTDPSQPDTTSTTETRTRSTTISPTSNSSSPGDTSCTTAPSEPLRSSETASGAAPNAESGSPSTNSPNEPTPLGSPTVANAAPCTCRNGASATESTTTPICGPTERDTNPDVVRFRYQSKTSRAERNAGLEGFEKQARTMHIPGGPGREAEGTGVRIPAANVHPTVKPIALMQWLCRLVTPPGGTILDPFLGSGSTGCAAVLEGFDFIGCEREEEYVAIAEARIAFWAQHVGREVEEVLPLYTASEREIKEQRDSGQVSILDLLEDAA